MSVVDILVSLATPASLYTAAVAHPSTIRLGYPRARVLIERAVWLASAAVSLTVSIRAIPINGFLPVAQAGIWVVVNLWIGLQELQLPRPPPVPTEGVPNMNSIKKRILQFLLPSSIEGIYAVVTPLANVAFAQLSANDQRMLLEQQRVRLKSQNKAEHAEAASLLAALTSTSIDASVTITAFDVVPRQL